MQLRGPRQESASRQRSRLLLDFISDAPLKEWEEPGELSNRARQQKGHSFLDFIRQVKNRRAVKNNPPLTINNSSLGSGTGSTVTNICGPF
jgi:hypothetical protein